MKTKLTLLLLVSATISNAQNVPVFGPEIDVTINGLSFDAMEPFITDDGNYLLFNNEGSGNKKLYYASRIDDSTFTYQGELTGTNIGGSPPYLDAVPDLDTMHNFVWTSSRGYPGIIENLHHGTFSSGTVTNIGRVYGDFYVSGSGWIAMDHGLSAGGQYLYFNNAYFNGCPGPCQTWIGVAQKVNDSTFNTLANSDALLANLNDTNYVSYATYISKNNRELYFTRIPAGALTGASLSEICVSTRTNETDPFGVPNVLISSPVTEIVEGPSLSGDQMLLYYHKNVNGVFELKLRYRQSGVGLTENQDTPEKTLLRIIDLTGREANPTPNTLLIYVYSDGTTERIFSIE